jgi:hypothetical protein
LLTLFSQPILGRDSVTNSWVLLGILSAQMNNLNNRKIIPWVFLGILSVLILASLLSGKRIKKTGAATPA